MSQRAAKRARTEGNCDGTGCGDRVCISCYGENEDEEEYTVPQDEEDLSDADTNLQKLQSQIGQLQETMLQATGAPAPMPDYHQMMAQLDHATAYGILDQMIRENPAAQVAISTAWAKQQAERRAAWAKQQTEIHAEKQAERQRLAQRVINFDCYSKTVWHTLNTSHYSKLKSSKQFEAAYDAWKDILVCVQQIETQTTEASSFGTKQSALETIRKILKSILLVNDTLGHEVRKELQSDDEIVNVMIGILEHMSLEERVKVGQAADEKGSLISKIEWVREEGKAYCLEGLADLDVVLEMMGVAYQEPA
ncbi:hypothetical protein B0J13DRAFT_569652 [Dactylonectria estremocensis]|uniref:Uncharacterized protein n=1 Tax=Dactylonectria estremocensis TaxID=1079267 RepID=A0A9P9IG64_9HYPO|nr:hypothetical protein B0J13DRAFT_577422 [Dactylonectria estremocensis]KAH7118175.1 hypothetical protein B0J13DRAFT_569652 [Dactylonectria estremocensis]